MPIRQKSPGAHAVIEILRDGLPEKVSIFSYDELVRGLTNSQITEINRYLRANHPEVAELIWETKGVFQDDQKFLVRWAMIRMIVALLTAGSLSVQPRKLHQLSN